MPLTIKIMIDKRSKDAPFVAYTPELDVASCGFIEEKARKNLQEAVTIVLEEVKKKGKLNELLEELGFQKEKKGFMYVRTQGDHLVYQKVGLLRPIVIPKYREIPEFIILKNLKTAGITREEYLNLLQEI